MHCAGNNGIIFSGLIGEPAGIRTLDLLIKSYSAIRKRQSILSCRLPMLPGYAPKNTGTNRELETTAHGVPGRFAPLTATST